MAITESEHPRSATTGHSAHNADSVLVEDLLPVGRKALISSNSARQPAQLVGSYSEAKLLRDIDILLFGQREFAWVSGGGAVGTYFSQLGAGQLQARSRLARGRPRPVRCCDTHSP